jgi:hypothetical protein
MSKGTVLTEFDNTRKRDFEEFVVARNNADDFLNFASLIAEIGRVRDSKLNSN